jgi:hypothetical protein
MQLTHAGGSGVDAAIPAAVFFASVTSSSAAPAVPEVAETPEPSSQRRPRPSPIAADTPEPFIAADESFGLAALPTPAVLAPAPAAPAAPPAAPAEPAMAPPTRAADVDSRRVLSGSATRALDYEVRYVHCGLFPAANRLGRPCP